MRIIRGGVAGATGRIVYTSDTPAEVRGEGDAVRIGGHAALFDVETELWPGYREVVRRGAFAKTIAEADVRGLWNHDRNFVLGRTRSGTLRLEENERGLGYEIDPPETQLVRDLVIAPMRRGDVDGSSFGFQAIKAPETVREDGTVLREILEARLFDVSPVTFPAYDDADAGLRAAELAGATSRLGEAVVVRALRASGLTATATHALLRGVIEALPADPGTSANRIDERARRLRRLEIAARE